MSELNFGEYRNVATSHKRNRYSNIFSNFTSAIFGTLKLVHIAEKSWQMKTRIMLQKSAQQIL